jgi:glycosyltransferase involved in cell wall biosynthesis
MNEPRILFSAYAFYPEFGGLEQQIYLLSREYIRNGYSVDVLTEKSKQSDLSTENIDGINVIRIPFSKNRGLLSYFRLIIYLSFFIIFNVRKYAYVHLRAALTLYPLVFGFWKWLGLIPSPTFVTADTGGVKDEIISIKNWPCWKFLVFIFNHHTYLNAICSANVEHYDQIGILSEKVTFIPSGIRIEDFKTSNYPKKVNSFLFIGRYEKYKGVKELLIAFSKLRHKYPNIKLHLAGDGTLKLDITKMIFDLDLENSVIEHGEVKRENLKAFYQLGECVVTPSYSEGFGLVIAESMVYKKIVVTTDVADWKKKVGNQFYYCKSKDVESLRETMEKVINKKLFAHLNYEPHIKTLDINVVYKNINKLPKINSALQLSS